jgi:hypothetical protein
MYNCGCFWQVVVYSCNCFWVALASKCKFCVCFQGSLFIVCIIVVVSKHFSLPYVQLSPTFTIICPEWILYYNIDITHFTPSSTRLPNHILCHHSQQTLISYRKFYCKLYSFTWYNEAVKSILMQLWVFDWTRYLLLEVEPVRAITHSLYTFRWGFLC